MPYDQLILVAILVISTLFYMTQWLPLEVTSMGIVAALLLTGVLAPEQALSGFSSSATITVGAMFVISAGIMRTGAMDGLADMLTRLAKGSQTRLLVILAVLLPLASAFLNNTPIVVLMIPILLTVSRRMDALPSKLLLPMVYLTTLGGTISLLGTSTNILVDGVYRQLGGAGLGFFEMTPFGVVYAAIGATYIVIASRFLLPNRAALTALGSRKGDTTYITEMMVNAESAAIGRSAEEVFTRIARMERRQPPEARQSHRRIAGKRRLEASTQSSDQGVELLAIVRAGKIHRAEETRALTLLPDDVLVVSGTPAELNATVRALRGSLTPIAASDADMPPAANADADAQVIEAIVLPNSEINGQLVGDLALQHHHDVRVLGVQHFGVHHFDRLRTLRLSSGDVLLLQGSPAGLLAASSANHLLVIEGVEQTIARDNRRWFALAILAGVVILASVGNVPIVTLAVVGALAMVLSGALRFNEAMSSLDGSTLLLLAGTIPLGAAMEQSGLAQRLVDALVRAVGVENPLLFIALFFGMAWILTELLSNNSVAVLLTPIAISLARTTGINPIALIMVVVFGASCGFVLPQGYQTYAMVMGPGGYRFKDFLRFGLPLSLLCWAAAVIFIPIFWPL